MGKLSAAFRKLVCIFFAFIISCPMILGAVSELFRIKTDVSLTNDNGCSETPVFSWYSFADGDFQRQFEQYLNNNLAGRGYMIKTYNQLNVFLFNQLKKQEIKDGYFYETLYLRDYCGMSYNPAVPEVKQRIDNYMSSLEQISRKLSLMGKKLIVYSSVSKFEYFEEYIPFRYKYIKDKKQFDYTAIDYFNDRISDYDVTYIKGRDLLSNLEYPVFYKSGIHWSRVAEQTVSKKILETIDGFYGNIKPFQFDGVLETTDEIFRERDMYHVANMWYAPREKYHEYKIKPAEDGNYSTPVIMIQGDSFAEGLFKDISNSRITENCYYVYNDRFISDINDQKVIDVRNADKESYKNIWDLFNLEYYIDEIDVLCIEFNPSFMNTESSGFVYYLNTLLGD